MTEPRQASDGSKRGRRKVGRNPLPPIETVSSEVRLDAGTAAPQAAPDALPPAPASDAPFREAIVAAACEVGFDGTGADGLKGYLRRIANEDSKTYFGVLSKLMLGDSTSSTQETVTRIERVIVRARE